MGALAAVVAALTITAPSAPTHAADDPQPEAQTHEVVDLELKIAAEGRDVGRIAQLVHFDTKTSLALRADDHEHAIDIEVRKADDAGKTLSVTLGYQVDGEAVMSALTVEASAKQAKIVRSEGGEVALRFEVAPKVVSTEELPAPPRPRIELAEDTNDPLAGL